MIGMPSLLGAPSSVALAVSLSAARAGAAATATGGGSPAPLTPVNTLLPAITGTVQEGQILSVSNGSWSNTPTSYSYQWRRGGVALAGSINASRTLTSADVGAAMSCVVTATNAAGSTPAATANTVAVIAASVPVPVNTVAPAVTGTGTVGQVLTTDNGTWSNSPTSYTYAWRRDGVDISGANSQTYKLVDADAAKAITCRVFATNGGGTTGSTSNSVTVAAAAVTLAALTVSNAAATVGSAFTSTISGATSGSTLSLTGAGAPGLTVSGNMISGTPTTAGAVNVVETLAGATNSPRTTSGLVTVVSGAVAALTFPAQGARYDIDFENSRSYAAVPIPSNATTFASQPDDTANAQDGRFFRQLVSQNLPCYAENKDGSLRRFATGTSLRRSTRGLLIEPIGAIGEQPILWTNNLTQTGWNPVNMTAAATQTSRSLVANSGTLLTATVASATILYPVTLAASTRNLYADIKRIAGTGTVEMTLDGGTTWVPIALTKPRYDGWGRYGIPRTAVTNPSFGFRLGTSGDQIAVAFVTSDLLAVEGSPWDQSGTGRRRLNDRPSSSIEGGSTTPVSSGLMDYVRANSSWAVYAEWDSQVMEANLFGQIIRPVANGSVQGSTDDGTNQIFTAAGIVRLTTDPTVPLKNRAILIISNGSAKICANGGAVVSANGTFGPYTTLDHKDLGSNGAGTANMAGYIQRLAILTTLPTDAQMQAWTAVS